jgi:histidyl-tRNA synthetase
LGSDIISKIQSTLTINSLEELHTLLPNSNVTKQLDLLWELAEAYGFEDWIQFDASLVRGLAYYTGIVFEGFDRAGELLRAICGGGRYDKLLTMYGATENIPAVGFGFGDCVIVELLKERNLFPDLPPSVEDVVIPFDESLRAAACQVANKLRGQGRSVDVVLSNKKMVWYVCWILIPVHFSPSPSPSPSPPSLFPSPFPFPLPPSPFPLPLSPSPFPLPPSPSSLPSSPFPLFPLPSSPFPLPYLSTNRFRSYKYADRVSAKRAILIAPNEWAQGLVRVTELRTGGGKGDTNKEVNVPFTEL